MWRLDKIDNSQIAKRRPIGVFLTKVFHLRKWLDDGSWDTRMNYNHNRLVGRWSQSTTDIQTILIPHIHQSAPENKYYYQHSIIVQSPTIQKYNIILWYKHNTQRCLCWCASVSWDVVDWSQSWFPRWYQVTRNTYLSNPDYVRRCIPDVRQKVHVR